MLVKDPTETSGQTWERIALNKQAQRDAALPAEWQLPDNLVPETQLNVMKVPAECGLLSSRELQITDTDAALLVQKLATREYSSYEVSLESEEYMLLKHDLEVLMSYYIGHSCLL